ncbi:MAG: hypothetical protein VB055_10660 [Oscillospiraceae bacterium]|nr:hypothetical protein [Oscillospiraceae bacterium]
MKNMYPASDSQKLVLKYAPHPTHCLLRTDLYTIQNLSDCVVYLWLNSGRSFWYHLRYVRGRTLIGYMLADGWWRYMPLHSAQIHRYF